MWMLVMFDLPVVQAAERAAATRFRLSLLDMGFSRAQLSVYMRFCTSYAQVQTYCQRVEAALPKGGAGQYFADDRQTVRTHHQFSRKAQRPSKKNTRSI